MMLFLLTIYFVCRDILAVNSHSKTVDGSKSAEDGNFMEGSKNIQCDKIVDNGNFVEDSECV